MPLEKEFFKLRRLSKSCRTRGHEDEDAVKADKSNMDTDEDVIMLRTEKMSLDAMLQALKQYLIHSMSREITDRSPLASQLKSMEAAARYRQSKIADVTREIESVHDVVRHRSRAQDGRFHRRHAAALGRASARRRPLQAS